MQASILRGRNHLDMFEFHKKYGPVARVGPRQLAFFTGQSFKDIYSRTGSRSFKKDPLQYSSPVNGVDHLHSALDDVEHARLRRLLAPGFSGEALKAQEPIVTRYVDAFIRRLRAESQSGPVDMVRWYNSITFDLTGDLMFGESFGCLETSEPNPWIEFIFGAVKDIVYMSVLKQFPWFEWLAMKMIPKSVIRKGINHFNLTVDKADRRIAMSSDRPDFMSAVMKNGFSETHGSHLRKQRIMSRAEIHSAAYM